MLEKIKCLLCDVGDLVPSESVRKIAIDGVEVEIPFRAHSCTSCGVVQGTDGDTRFNARAMRRARKRRLGQLTGEEVRSIRQRLCLTQQQAAKLFGGGPVAFSKYENDEVSQSESMDRLIWLAGQNPWVVNALAERIGLALTEQLPLTFEKLRVAYEEEYLAHAKALVRNTRVALQGFSELAHASNDEKIYQPMDDSRTKIREAA